MIACRVCGPVDQHAPGCPAGDAEIRRVGDQLLVDAELQED